MKLSFYGAAQEVTGSCYLLEAANKKILIDCGLFQGTKECEDKNFDAFLFKPAEVDIVLVSHAHLDHVGRLPKLVRDGFKGKIYSTAPTRELARFILDDALHLAEREQRPLYDEMDIEHLFGMWQDVPYYKTEDFGGVNFVFKQAGHILGSALIEIIAEGKKILFSGDLGNIPSILLPPPDEIKDVDYLIVESTYGDRTHEAPQDRTILLERAAEDVAFRRGTLLIPAFATERTQELLFLLNELAHDRRIPEMPIFVDAPLAIHVTGVYEKYPELYKQEIQELLKVHPNVFKSKRLHFTSSVEESKGINNVPMPKVIIAGSGMMNGGRVLHHASRYLGDPKSILLFVGYQSSGSLGRRLVEGEKDVKLFGEHIMVQAEIRKINGFSAHADNPQLFNFVSVQRDTLKHVFVIHGEQKQASHFVTEIRDRLGVSADAPSLNQVFDL